MLLPRLSGCVIAFELGSRPYSTVIREGRMIVRTTPQEHDLKKFN